jgi:Flp pilus assembly pilin Flp
MTRRLNSLRPDHGQTMTEYAIVLVLIFGLVITVLPLLASSVLRMFSDVSNAFGG